MGEDDSGVCCGSISISSMGGAKGSGDESRSLNENGCRVVSKVGVDDGGFEDEIVRYETEVLDIGMDSVVVSGTNSVVVSFKGLCKGRYCWVVFFNRMKTMISATTVTRVESATHIHNPITYTIFNLYTSFINTYNYQHQYTKYQTDTKYNIHAFFIG